MALIMCIHAIETMTRLWKVSNDEDKQGMARHLFEYVMYDLDAQEITDFRLKPWAGQFSMLRSALYTEEKNYELDYNGNRMTTPRLKMNKPLSHLPQITWNIWNSLAILSA